MSDGFAQSWRAEVLAAAPMIAPARQFLYPTRIAGEEEALTRGALQVMVSPRNGGAFLATFALGFRHASLPTGIFATPDPDQLCALAGGYAYLLETLRPEEVTLLLMKPVTALLPDQENKLLLFAGFHDVLAWGVEGVRWQTRRLSWDGVRMTKVEAGQLHGFGWNLMTDREVAFQIDLKTGEHWGGAAPGTR